MRGKQRLVVCFDGTWNNVDTNGKNSTNVEKIAQAVKGDSGDIPQITLYLRGVGSTGHRIQRIIDGAIGRGVDDNIRSAYQFLAQNYLPKRGDGAGGQIEADEIFLFGFSRGAFSARSLAGFIGSAGLLMRHHLHRLEDAWAYYRKVGERTSRKFCNEFECECHHDPEIKFLGVWDTVGALGIPTSTVDLPLLEKDTEFHDTTPSKIVKNAFHALAIDEYRDEFVPTLWTGETPTGAKIEQMWFAGAHSDVGGGYTNRELANIPLCWMAEKAQDCGLKLDVDLLPKPAELNALAPQHESRVSFGYKDRFTPTIRVIEEKPFDTSWRERAYRPTGKDGEPLKTIAEAIHPCAAKRFEMRHSAKVELITGDDSTNVEEIVYEPKNLDAALKRS